MSTRNSLTALALLGLTFGLVGFVAAEKKYDGTQRIQRTDGRTFEGEVEVDDDGGYLVKMSSGITVKIPKNQVMRIVAVRERDPRPQIGTTPAAKVDLDYISDSDIDFIIGGVTVNLEEMHEGGGDPTKALPVNESSVAEMKRIAGSGAEVSTLETAHFVFVYTSDRSLARELASRLESVYRWNVRLLDMLGIPYRQPKYKLEVFFFGEHEEYARYQNFLGTPDSVGTLGFYRPDNNRSAFFDMNTWPPTKVRLERAKNPNIPYAERRKERNLVTRWNEHNNVEVVQHEAAHHIHFNIGMFNVDAFPVGALPRWTVEGLATMFEMPPSRVGASFGATNHVRLEQFRRFFGTRGQRLPNLTNFILDDWVFLSGGGTFYPLGWALTHYLWNSHREQYGEWVLWLYTRADEGELSKDEKQKKFEELFGEVDDDWKKKFVEYMNGIQLRRSVLPPDIFGR